MGPTRHLHYHDQSPEDSGEDSDIQEIAVIMPGEPGRANVLSTSSSPPPRRAATASSHSQSHASPVLKRRKSSPQMDPIPIPSHLLGQRTQAPDRYGTSATLSETTSYPDRLPHNLLHSPYATISADHLLTNHTYPGSGATRSPPSGYLQTNRLSPTKQGPQIIGFPPPEADVCSSTSSSSRSSNPVSDRVAARSSANPSAQTRPGLSSSRGTPRPVSSALAQAVSRRKESLAQQRELQQKLERNNQRRSEASQLDAFPAKKEPLSTDYAEKPVMWSPQAPTVVSVRSAQEKGVGEGDEPAPSDDYGKLQPARPAKKRVAHKPTIPSSRYNRPRAPLGDSRKVPLALRVKYLDVIITEYLNTGHPEEQSYQDGLNDEKALAERAASKGIYVNLVAGLKKKIRERAGISTLPQDEDPKFVNGNKVVSHEEILTGKVRGTFSIEKKRKLSDPSDLNEQELYDRLSRYLLPHDQLEAYGYPRPDSDNPRLRMAPLGKDGQKLQLRAELASSYICERCAKSYRIGEDGLPLTTNKCIFHPGHLWNERINKSLEKRYSCCKGDPSAGGCSSNLYHVHRGELELENYSGYVETEQKDEREPNKHGIFALDCEMSYTTYGLELTRVTVVNFRNEVVYEKLVKPKNPILDYNTKYSGIRPGDLDHVDTSLHDVQRDLLRKFSSKTILVGHSLDSDMRALKIFHKYFIDTAQLFPHKRGLPYKRALRTLMVENLQVIIQEDAGHDSKEDACAAFRLVMWKAKTDVPAKAS